MGWSGWAACLLLAACGGKSSLGRTGAAGAAGAAGATGGAGAGAAGASTDASTSTDAAVALSDAAACSPQTLERQAPDLLLLLDRSASMNQQLNDMNCPPDAGPGAAELPCVTKWGEVTKAINQVVAETETTLHWGLKYFPNTMLCGIDPGAAVGVGANNAAAIAASIAATTPLGSTPTRLAITSAGDYLNVLHDGNPKVVVLATDGLPNCMPGGSSPAVFDGAGAVAAIKTLADSGIPVYVIGIGDVTSGVTTLDQMATAGGRPRPVEPLYYPVDSSLNLFDALHAIGAQSGVCSYALPGVPTRPSDVVISTGGVVIPHDAAHAEGWDYDATMNSIQLYGSWCAKDKMAALTGLLETQRCP
jgi:hypothetical protein